MDAIREQLEKPIIAGIVGVVIGIILGLIWGYVIAPIEWKDAPVELLREDLQEKYLRMAIDSYALNMDTSLAEDRWQDLGSGANELLAQIEADPEQQNEANIASFREFVDALPEGSAAAEPEDEGSSIVTILLTLVLIALILAGIYFGYTLFRRSKPTDLSAAAEAQMYTDQLEQTDFSARDGVPPMSQFMTTYMIGDDLFDDSFSIDSPTGEFLGECGVGISESIGVGEPKKVAAFEVWLFDKNDIQTVTKVLMSQHAHDDETLRGRLAAKGDPFLVEPGGETVLETATLRLIARVVDLAYGIGGASPANSFFDRVTLELAIWQKD